MIFLILITAVAAEELFFRGVLLRILKDKPQFFRITATAAAFAFAHLLNVSRLGLSLPLLFQVLYAFAAGMFLAALALRAGSCIPSAAAHALLNLSALSAGAGWASPFCLYIDPGTGSMLFTFLLGVISVVFSSVTLLFIKGKTLIAGRGKIDRNRRPVVIFSDSKRYWTVFEPVIRELTASGIEVTYLTASEDDPAFGCGTPSLTAEYIGSGNRMYARLNNLNAVIVLSTTPGLDVYQWKRSRFVKWYVHIPHAASEVVLYRMFGLDYYDAVLLSGEYQEKDIRALEQLRALPAKELVSVGIPYMDGMLERFHEAGKISDHLPTVLLAPSWGKGAILNVYGEKIIEVLLKSDFHVIIRPHPQSFTSEKEMMDRLMEKYPPSDRLEWNRDTDNFEVLRRSDVLISDFSGVIFDFSLVFGKPVIYTEPNLDLAPYDAWWLKTPLWTYSALPRLGRCLTRDNMENLNGLIRECLSDPDVEAGIKEVCAETWMHRGEGASRAAEYIMEKYKALTGEES